MKFESSLNNSVFCIDDLNVYKGLSNTKNFEREVAGAVIFGLLSNGNVPTVSGIGAGYVLSEYLPQVKTAYDLYTSNFISKEKINEDVAKFIAKVYFESKKGLSIPNYLSWEKRLEGIKEKFYGNVLVYKNYVNNSNIEKLKIDLSKFAKSETTLLHRDIHLGNILYTTDTSQKMYVIDFEHCMEGPLELEFSNSIFWNDDKSLDVPGIVKILKNKYSIPYSTEFAKELLNVYIADQLNIALDNNDFSKLKLLANRF